ncbi:MAG: DUF4920 domain-containing protein [Saprospiraceae bacterium]
MNKITLLLVLAASFTACKNDKTATVIPNSNSAFQVFGDSVLTVEAISVKDATEVLKTHDSIFCTITGYVTGVCQVKGCWMMLSQTEKDSSGFFVKFKDYAFFVPKDISGRKVTVKGVAYKQVTSVEELRHYAEDEGKSKLEIDAIVDPREELKFMAQGVLLKNDQL